jgi:hypothetical protein
MQINDQNFQPINGGIKRPRLGCAFALLPIAAIILTVVGSWYLYTSWMFFSKGIKVQATVVRLESSSSSDSGITYAPICSYQVDGKTYEVKSGTTSDPPLHKKGDVVTLFYDPNHPQNARENSLWELWGIPLIICPISVVMLFLSIAIPLLMRVKN